MFANIKNKISQKDFIEYVIANYEKYDNKDFTDLMEGWKYYDDCGEIDKKQRLVVSVDSENKPYDRESKLLANTKLKHSFYKKLVKQKVSYVLSHPFTIRSTYASSEEEIDKFVNSIQDYVDDAFYSKVIDCARDSIVGKFGWLYTYYDEKGILKFNRVDPKQIIPIWKDTELKELDAIIHRYSRYEFVNNSEMKEIKCVDYYTLEGRTKYEFLENGKLKEVEKLTPYITINGANYTWNRLPFTWFKYDSDGSSLLVKIKSLIDEYDYLTSYVSDMIKDHPNALLVIKGYSAGSVEEFVRNASIYRKLFVQSDGDVSAVEQPLQVDQIMLHLEQLRKDIFEFASGVDTTDDKNLNDTSGTALKFTYAELDMDCSYWMAQLKQSIHNLFYFILTDLIIKKQKDFTSLKFDIVFNTDVIINEVEAIQNCVQSTAVLPLKEIMIQHPWVVNATKVYDEMQEQKEQEFEQEVKLKEQTSSDNNTTSSTNA